jgi:hypothetical protein
VPKVRIQHADPYYYWHRLIASRNAEMTDKGPKNPAALGDVLDGGMIGEMSD